MPVGIPLDPGEPEQIVEIAVDGEPYVLRVRWNSRDAAWYMDAFERDGKTSIARSIKLVLGVLLGRRVIHPLFAGGLFLIEESGSGIEAGLFDLGRRVQLVQMTAADMVLLALPPPGASP